MNILMLCERPVDGANAQTIIDHIEAFNGSRHNITILSGRGHLHHLIPFDGFDAIVVHWTLHLIGDRYVSPECKNAILNFTGPKVVFLQDEYRFVNQMMASLRLLGVDVLFTCVPPSAQRLVYPERKLPGVRLVHTLTGYVPPGLPGYPVKPIRKRRIDIGYRGRFSHPWYGRLGMQKRMIGEGVRPFAKKRGFKYDISNLDNKRIYGGDWYKWLSKCKVMLGTEGGATVDQTGWIYETLRTYCQSHPFTGYERVADIDCKGTTLRQADERVSIAQISPKIFEAIALRTGLLLFEGEYSGVIEPYTHYYPLKHDYSNINDAMDWVGSDEAVQSCVDRAYEDVALDPQYQYPSFIHGFDAVMQETLAEYRFEQVADRVPERVG